MNLRNYLTVAAILAFAFGIALAVFPGPLVALFGPTLDAAGAFIGRLFGAMLIGFGTLNWLARRAHEHDEPAIGAILMANLAADALGFVIALLGQLSAELSLNTLGWSTVLLYLLLAAGAAYFLFMPEARPLARARR